MSAPISHYSPAPQTRTEITCTKCGKAASVPFAPTPGRPVFCRDCFVRPTGGSTGFQGNRSSGFASNADRPARVPVPGARKRMMAQGRKGHFMYDAKEALGMREGGMDDKDVRAFLEGLFARGARQSTEDAQVFLDEKETEGKIITADQRDALGRLLERYSFWR
ncbi:MAG TPA: CxxC-x17-CxxC domain-containing protein [Candidatus Thermoplasmatota archaeon]|nr:CxxC-x17-CxxC domain-containing protein [Candidatus Thermoplasmatota archaeon]